MYAIQRDGSKHNDDWTPYIQKTADLTSEWKTITTEFQMTEDTDPESVLSLSMGVVAGKRSRFRSSIVSVSTISIWRR